MCVCAPHVLAYVYKNNKFDSIINKSLIINYVSIFNSMQTDFKTNTSTAK